MVATSINKWIVLLLCTTVFVLFLAIFCCNWWSRWTDIRLQFVHVSSHCIIQFDIYSNQTTFSSHVKAHSSVLVVIGIQRNNMQRHMLVAWCFGWFGQPSSGMCAVQSLYREIYVIAFNHQPLTALPFGLLLGLPLIIQLDKYTKASPMEGTAACRCLPGFHLGDGRGWLPPSFGAHSPSHDIPWSAGIN